MTNPSRKLSAQLARLSASEKIALAEDLLASVSDEDNAAWNQAWGDEAARRSAAYDRGETSADDAEDVLVWLKAPCRER
jgi:putative addiction module component (TIGR02574 family)